MLSTPESTKSVNHLGKFATKLSAVPVWMCQWSECTMPPPPLCKLHVCAALKRHWGIGANHYSYEMMLHPSFIRVSEQHETLDPVQFPMWIGDVTARYFLNSAQVPWMVWLLRGCFPHSTDCLVMSDATGWPRGAPGLPPERKEGFCNTWIVWYAFHLRHRYCTFARRHVHRALPVASPPSPEGLAVLLFATNIGGATYLKKVECPTRCKMVWSYLDLSVLQNRLAHRRKPLAVFHLHDYSLPFRLVC